jgi:hypothetical protein
MKQPEVKGWEILIVPVFWILVSIGLLLIKGGF